MNATTVHNGFQWINTTGINSEPGIGGDWLKSGITAEVVKYIENNGTYYKTVKGFGNIADSFQIGDEITYRDPATGERGTYYVKNPALTLPADFSDDTKIDAYNVSDPQLQ